MNLWKKGTGLLMALTLTGAALAGCGGPAKETSSQSTAPAATSEFKMLEGDALKGAIQKEGKIISYGMPDSWANWKESWEVFSGKYGVIHTDTDMSSAEEIAKFKAEKDNPVADLGDIGIGFGAKAKAEGVSAAYKNKYWNEIPDWAKDPDGNWCVWYTGSTSFLVNTKLVKNVPTSWADLLKPEYKGQVVLGDPTKANQAMMGVLSAAFANGGDESNIQPGIEFLAKLAKAGNLKPIDLSVANIQKGEVPIAVLNDFNALGYKDQLKMDELKVVIPSDGSAISAYVCMINKVAPHPYAARAMVDHILSDEGQILLAKGFARPIRDVKLPADVQAKLLPKEAYKASRPIKDFATWEKTTKDLPRLWQEQVLTQMQ
ncbi:extracellular solute-binding protein [Heliobacterium gestii]|uniref:Extracellular solute-binding protein n=1 Tax=Heliomicrobium gestii TaxID=2699 RepID=A0A845LE85_HELGE|nr:ABC transporter substrate-binding protein [Heliomicrobium gestii]MBM7867420.1 putative spermidine/putrescine transport system substrate-binding protein [Heliomicrobium gestii]MZP43684.1 extracellular solute-binding protein [Heliomicrobium gestii]